tara:strand:- start:196 stop:435 length:240 start_codon:yes stop_codon:yes gene_type:complete
MDIDIPDLYNDIINRIFQHYDIYYENKEEFIREIIMNYLKDKIHKNTYFIANKKEIDILYNKVIDNINENTLKYEEINY